MASVQGGGSAAPAKPDAAWVAQEFVKRYYEVLAKHPKYLNRFYKEESQFTLTIRNHGVPETRQTVSTTQAIQDKVNSTVQGAKITIEHSEAQYSLNSGVLLQVDGRLTLPNEVGPSSAHYLYSSRLNGCGGCGLHLYKHPICLTEAAPKSRTCTT
eukprot:GHUV01016403.1.p2 GENE.GHUV01016403.1~~GHUV01016403.1.p2  ORF type:complete len:156 (+),score=14.76 GHUV01016403.1:274-741(+)